MARDPKFIKALDEQYQYITSELKKKLELNEVETKSPALDAYLRNWTHPPRSIPSHIRRLMYPLRNGRSVMLLEPEYICSVFKMSKNTTSAIYAMLYSTLENGQIVHKFVCYGPTFTSQDGEYRHRFLPYELFLDRVNKDNYIEMTELVQEFVSKRIKSGVYVPFVDYFIDSKLPQDVEQKLRKSISDSRLVIDLFVLTWLTDFTRAKLKLLENHINPAFASIVCDTKDKEASNIYDKLVAKYTIQTIHQEVLYFQTLVNITQARYPEVGQKIIPIKYQESIEFGNIQYELWREWYMMRKCANLMLNFISPTFPYIYGWFLIHGIDARIFDNQAMYNKFVQSEIASDVNKSLREADSYTRNDKVFINSRFERLSDKIRRAGKYGDMALRLTNTSFVAIQEHVHITIGDAHIHRNNYPIEYTSKWLRDYFTNIEVFKKQMFEFIYGFYCLNSRLAIVHGDLHLNNATMYPLLNYYEKRTDPTNNNMITEQPYMMYIVHNDVFLLPQTGITSVIIDLSRSVFGDREKLVEEFDEVFADTLLRRQRHYIYRIMERNYPIMIKKYGNEIKQLMLDNFPVFFRIFSATDMLNLSKRLRSLYEEIDVDMNKEEIIPFLKEIEVEAEKLFLNKLEDAVEGRVKKLEDIH